MPRHWDPLLQPLMRPVLVDIRYILLQDAAHLRLTENHEMIETRAPDRAQEAVADPVLLGRPVRGAPFLDAAAGGHVREGRAIRTVVIAHDEAGAQVEGRRLTQLLRHPRISRMARHAHVHHLARGEFDQEEGIERTEEKVGDGQDVSGPDLPPVVAQEGRPDLTTAGRTRVAHVALDGGRGDADVEREEFTRDARGTRS